jgi:hypothetical protein
LANGTVGRVGMGWEETTFFFIIEKISNIIVIDSSIIIINKNTNRIYFGVPSMPCLLRPGKEKNLSKKIGFLNDTLKTYLPFHL